MWIYIGLEVGQSEGLRNGPRGIYGDYKLRVRVERGGGGLRVARRRGLIWGSDLGGRSGDDLNSRVFVSVAFCNFVRDRVSSSFCA